MPSYLMHYATQNIDDTFDTTMAKAIAEAPEYSILAANLIWVLIRVADAPRHRVHTIESFSDYMPPNISEAHVSSVGTLVDWIVEQPVLLASEAPSVTSKLHTNSSGVHMY